MNGSSTDPAMETTKTTTEIAPAVESGSQPAQPGQQPVLSPAPDQSSVAAKRAKWRAKYYAKKERKNRISGQLPLDAIPTVANAPSAPAAPVSGPAAIPWDSSTLKPLFDELIPALEKADVESITKRAATIAPEIADTVKTDAAWSPTAKAALSTNCPPVAAKWLNASGIGAENAGEVAIVIAAVCIWNSRRVLLGKLDEIAKAKGSPSTDAKTVQFPAQKTAP